MATTLGSFSYCATSSRVPTPLLRHVAGSTAPTARSVAQHKVFEDKRAFATWERSTAGAACYLRLSRLRSRFDLDHVVERLAVRARERNERRWPALSHSTPPTPILIIESPADPQCQLLVTAHKHTDGLEGPSWPLVHAGGLFLLRRAYVNIGFATDRKILMFEHVAFARRGGSCSVRLDRGATICAGADTPG